MSSPPTPTTPAPAHNLDAERTTLGALLTDPDKLIDVGPLLRPDDFYDPIHAAIYGAMQRLHEERRPVDLVTVSDALKGDHTIDTIGGPAFLADLANEVPTASHAVQYAAIVREKSLRRQLGAVGRTIVQLASTEGRGAGELLESAEREILSLSRQSPDSRPATLTDLAGQRYEHYTALYEAEDASAHYGIATGFERLDHLLTGLTPGHLMILAGRPSMGKTALALDIARNVAGRQAKAVTIFSLEMTKEQLFDRLIAGAIGIEASKLRQGHLTEEEFARMGAAFDRLQDLPISIDDDPDTTLANLRSKARRQQMEHGLDLLIVDYLQLIEVTDRAAGENQTQRITYISKSLKTLARELQCPVIALSQLSRSCEQRTPSIPILSDLRDSGAIEQDADTVLMLYRAGYYDEDGDNPDATDVYVRKNRHGPTGRVELRFDRQRMAFHSIAPTPVSVGGERG